MTIRYIYLDDGPPETVRPYIRAVQKHRANLQIELSAPEQYSKEMQRQMAEQVEGVLLDLRLDQRACVETAEGPIRADYRATTLAQEMRTRATEEEYRDRPIVLWSTQANLRKSYTYDDTGHDLFDLICVKEDLLDEQLAEEVAAQMCDLPKGYEVIRTKITSENVDAGEIECLLELNPDRRFVDPRILSRFEGVAGPIPPHEIARFVLRSLLDRPGPLIDRATVAARLGINERESTDVGKLWNALDQSRYRGVFSDGWARWWSTLVEEWWNSFEERPAPLRALPARERVAFLRNVLGVEGLVVADPIREGYSTRFWTVCPGTGRPLDPRDGYQVIGPTLLPWQDRVYASREGILGGRLVDLGYRLDPLEESSFAN